MRNEFGTVATQDLFATLLGDKLGGGSARQVYDCALLPRYVVKVEDVAGSFQNILESEIWQEVQFTEHAKWFAPVHSISITGTVLIMAKTKPLKDFPRGFKVPAYMTDLKPENFGRYKGRIVAHDYGLTLLMSKGLTKRMRPAD